MPVNSFQSQLRHAMGLYLPTAYLTAALPSLVFF